VPLGSVSWQMTVNLQTRVLSKFVWAFFGTWSDFFVSWDFELQH